MTPPAACACQNAGLSAFFRHMSTVAEIESALEKLPPEAQREVAVWLDARIAGFDASVESAWTDEVKRRLDEIESGRVAGVPAEQVFARARRMLTP